jgi:hypothetical protein
MNEITTDDVVNGLADGFAEYAKTLAEIEEKREQIQRDIEVVSARLAKIEIGLNTIQAQLDMVPARFKQGNNLTDSHR